MCYGYHTGTYLFREHQKYGTFTMKLPFAKFVQNITTNGTKVNVVDTIEGADDEKQQFYITHGWVLWVGWGIFGFVQLLTTRYFKAMPGSIWIHIVSGWIILIITFVMSLLAIKKQGNMITNEFHNILGVIILAYVGFLNISGIITKYRWLKKIPIREIHKYSGFLIIIGS